MKLEWKPEGSEPNSIRLHPAKNISMGLKIGFLKYLIGSDLKDLKKVYN